MALGETVGACIGSPGKWCASGASGCRGVIVAARSHGPASTNFWPGTRCRQPRSCTASPPRANLSREEPDAGNSHVRHCEGWGPVTTPPTRPVASRFVTPYEALLFHPLLLQGARGRAGSMAPTAEAQVAAPAKHVLPDLVSKRDLEQALERTTHTLTVRLVG